MTRVKGGTVARARRKKVLKAAKGYFGSKHRENEISYSKFINGLSKAGIEINRKMLSEIAIDNPKYFTELVAIAKDALNGKEYAPKKVAKETKKEETKETKAPAKKPAAKKTTTKKEEK